MERLFNEIDRDNSGTLDRDEIGALAEKLGKQMSDEELRAQIRAVVIPALRKGRVAPRALLSRISAPLRCSCLWT